MEPEEPQEDSEEREIARGRQTRNLMIAGAVLLLLPLIGAAIVYMRDSSSSIDPGGSMLLGFQRRYGDAPVAAPAATAASAIPVQKSLTEQQSMAASPAEMPQQPVSAAPPQGGGSLGFITGGSDYAQPDQKAAAPVQPATAPVQAQATAQPAAQPKAGIPPSPTAAAAKAPAKQPFVMPKLQATKGSNFSTGFGGKGQKAAQAPAGMPPGMDMSKMMQGMPPGGIPGMPPGMDMSKMMQGMPQGAGAQTTNPQQK